MSTDTDEGGFEADVTFWRYWAGRDAEPVWDRFIAAESRILRHHPASPAEAGVVAEVLLANAADSGPDREALHNLHAFLGGTTTIVGGRASGSAA
jgi:hypothetical protein